MGLNNIDLCWWNNKINFGDQLNKYLIEKISGKKVILNETNSDKTHYLCIGSIFHLANKNSIIWGSGLISKKKRYLPLSSPKKIHAVRGPLTKKYIEKSNIKCPSIFGDPALLLNKYYKPKVNKKYKLGIIPHYTQVDYDIIKSYKINKQVKIISLINDNCEDVINQINECENIISSSLHGLIVADVYQIPNIWFEIKKGIFRTNSVIGNGFKFYDYYMSIGMNDFKCLKLIKGIPLNNIINMCKLKRLKINLEILESSCPFIKNNA